MNETAPSRGWARLVDSIRGARYHGSKFYKPVCLIAAIDLSFDTPIDPLDVDAEAIIDRFGDYVRPHFPKRAALGWQPLWYLANDGMWSFLKEGRLSGPRAMKGRYQPKTRRTVLEQFDRLVIDPSLRPLWESPGGRGLLRNELIFMLWRDNEPSSRVFARALYNPAHNAEINYWPSEAEMAMHERRLFGEQDLFDKLNRAEARSDVGEPANVAAAIQALEQDPLGAQFDPHEETLVIRQVGATADEEVATRPLTAQLHHEVRRKVGVFAAQARRLDNLPGWGGIGGLCERLADVLERPTRDVPEVIGLIYSATLELGSFLEFDNELRRTSDAFADTLEPSTRRGLDDLVRTLAPWVRLFPTAQEADDATGQLLVHAPLAPTAEAAVELARIARVVREGDAEVLKGLLSAGRRGEKVGDKANARGVLSARNMVVAIACAAGTLYVDAIASDFATKSVLAQRAGTFLANAEAEVLALVEDLPADLRLAFEGLIRQAR